MDSFSEANNGLQILFALVGFITTVAGGWFILNQNKKDISELTENLKQSNAKIEHLEKEDIRLQGTFKNLQDKVDVKNELVNLQELIKSHLKVV